VSEPSAYQRAGVDTRAGDLAVELMRRDVDATHRGRVLGGVGGFAGLFDAGFLRDWRHPVLATSTDGVGTKVAIAQALDRHDTIGIDLVAMVIDDIVVVGATPLMLTDYIACGKVQPERIAAIVSGIAQACAGANVALVGGETAEHPGLLEPEEYDLAAAATGVVEADSILGPDKVQVGDRVIAIASSGLHSNGYSLARHIVAEAKIPLSHTLSDGGPDLGSVLLEPTVIYTSTLLSLFEDQPGVVHSASHVTGGGIAQNLQRVLPQGVAVTLARGSWSVPEVFGWLAARGGIALAEVEDTWNLGIGMILVCQDGSESQVIDHLARAGHRAWQAGVVEKATGAAQSESAKGVRGGAVQLTGDWS
jgi:phosphoribosylformylglycinamidine cyclo-ligase